MGIEPTPSAWKAEVLPLNYTRLIIVVGWLKSPADQVIYPPTLLKTALPEQKRSTLPVLCLRSAT